MKLLEEKIVNDGVIKSGNVLKVDSFLNHQIDVPFVAELGKELKRLFADRNITKILTIEASGIGYCLRCGNVFWRSSSVCQEIKRQQYG